MSRKDSLYCIGTIHSLSYPFPEAENLEATPTLLHLIILFLGSFCIVVSQTKQKRRKGKKKKKISEAINGSGNQAPSTRRNLSPETLRLTLTIPRPNPNPREHLL